MKKLLLLTLFFVCVFAFGETNQERELDFLLFMPNSSDQFVDEKQAAVHLDNLAKQMVSQNIAPGQIHVYGYAAIALNDIASEDISKERALFVINELKKRGVPAEIFSEPKGLGEVGLWGDNTDSENRGPNRRVRVMLDGKILVPVQAEEKEPEIAITETEPPQPVAEAVKEKSNSGLLWKILLPLLLLALVLFLIFWLLKNRKKPAENAAAAAPVVIAPIVVMREEIINLEEEIRIRAYEIDLERYDQNGDMDGDWHKAVPEVCARYEARGYETYAADGTWWAKIQIAETKEQGTENK